MIRGVNKNVIEISETGNDCFERAILFVRPESGHSDSEQLRRRAGEFLSGLRLRPRFYSRGKFWLAAAKLLVTAAAGAAIGAAAAAMLLAAA